MRFERVNPGVICNMRHPIEFASSLFSGLVFQQLGNNYRRRLQTKQTSCRRNLFGSVFSINILPLLLLLTLWKNYYYRYEYVLYCSLFSTIGSAYFPLHCPSIIHFTAPVIADDMWVVVLRFNSCHKYCSSRRIHDKTECLLLLHRTFKLTYLHILQVILATYGPRSALLMDIPHTMHNSMLSSWRGRTTTPNKSLAYYIFLLKGHWVWGRRLCCN